MNTKHSGCGIIIFNKKLETILVESFKGKNNCSFAKGRKDFPTESDMECALREVKEELGKTPENFDILNNGDIFATEELGSHSKKHYIGYYIALIKDSDNGEFTYDPKELKCKPYWATKETVLEKFYGGERKKIYENAYEYIKNYLNTIITSLNTTTEVENKTLNVNDTIVKPLVTNSWASIAKSNLNIQQISNTPQTSNVSVMPNTKFKQTVSILSDAECIKIGKTLSWLLRHGLNERNINMRSDGYVLLSDVFSQKEFSHLTVSDITHIVDTNSKKRYELLEENKTLYIRASQGHSLDVGKNIDQSIAFERITTPYPKCIHGTDKKAYKLIQKTGLNRMSRQHIHFALSEPSDSTVVSGARSTSKVLIYVDMEKAMNDGIQFYLSENNVILSEGINGTIDPKYFKDVVILK